MIFFSEKRYKILLHSLVSKWFKKKRQYRRIFSEDSPDYDYWNLSMSVLELVSFSLFPLVLLHTFTLRSMKSPFSGVGVRLPAEDKERYDHERCTRRFSVNLRESE